MADRTWGSVTCSLALALALALALTAASCGGGGDDDADEVGAGDGASQTSTSAAVSPTTQLAAELPTFVADFSRVCTTQVGFPGATAYEPVAGLHPAVVFEEFRGGNLIESARTFPQGWTIKNDANFEDNSELAAVQLVACADRTSETPNGTMCEFDNDGQQVKLELVDSVYEVKVFTATTGRQVHAATLEAKNSDCPFIATFREGDTTFVNEPDDDAYIGALKPVIAPE